MEKDVGESQHDAARNRMGMRHRNKNGNGDQEGKKESVPRQYGNSIGMIGQRNQPDSDSTDSDSEPDTMKSQSSQSGHHRKYRSRHERKHIRQKLKKKSKSKIPGHVAWTKWMHSRSKNELVALIGEFVGTTMFLFSAFAATSTANLRSTIDGAQFEPGTVLYIALAFGFSLMVNAWIFFRISGGLFNPAVTLALLLTRDLSPLRALLIFIAQLTGACFASYLVQVLLPGGNNVQTTLGAGTTIAQGLWLEALTTFGLVFTIIMLAKEKHSATFIAPIGIGMSLFIGELVAVFYTGGSLNPARSFGPAAVAREFPDDHWVYWVGPAIGSLLAFSFFRLMKVLEYEMANPGQDGDDEADPTKNPNHELAKKSAQREHEVEEIQAIEDEGGFENMDEDAASIGGAVVTDEETGEPLTGTVTHEIAQESNLTPVRTKQSRPSTSQDETDQLSPSRPRTQGNQYAPINKGHSQTGRNASAHASTDRSQHTGEVFSPTSTHQTGESEYHNAYASPTRPQASPRAKQPDLEAQRGESFHDFEPQAVQARRSGSSAAYAERMRANRRQRSSWDDQGGV